MKWFYRGWKPLNNRLTACRITHVVRFHKEHHNDTHWMDDGNWAKLNFVLYVRCAANRVRRYNQPCSFNPAYWGLGYSCVLATSTNIGSQPKTLSWLLMLSRQTITHELKFPELCFKTRSVIIVLQWTYELMNLLQTLSTLNIPTVIASQRHEDI